ncbi:MAG: NADPH-dependent F420 reductase [Acidimicrobiales bacterium]
MTIIGLIGAGHIGSQLARLAVANGYDVVVSNSRGPDTLGDLVVELGDHARADTAERAAAAADVAVVSIPLKNVDKVPVAPLGGKVVIDTSNYYPARDGQIAALDEGRTTVSQLLQDHLPESRVVKAFNSQLAAELTTDGAPPGTPGRRALAVFGDDDAATATVASMIDDFGFDAVDGGQLSEGWRIQAGTPAYGQRRTADELRADLAAATR